MGHEPYYDEFGRPYHYHYLGSGRKKLYFNHTETTEDGPLFRCPIDGTEALLLRPMQRELFTPTEEEETVTIDVDKEEFTRMLNMFCFDEAKDKRNMIGE